MKVSKREVGEKNIVGIGGGSRSGKDTVARFIAERTGARIIAFADPLKELVGAVFDFNAGQLYGSSEERNEFDPRYDRGGANDVGGLDARHLAWVRFEAVAWEWLGRVLPEALDSFARSLAHHRLVAWLHDALSQPRINARRPTQTLGTEWGRSIAPRIWIDHCLARADRLLKQGVRQVVISDVRYIEEAKTIKEVGHSIWKVYRPGIDKSQVQRAGVPGHSSEAEIDSPEFEALVDIGVQNDSSLEALKRYVVTHCDIEWPR